MTMGSLRARADSRNRVFPSSAKRRGSARSTFVPATAPSDSQLVTNLFPDQWLLVWLLSPIGESFGTDAPVRSYRVSCVCLCPLKTVVSLTVSTFSLCVIVEVYSALAIIPIFLLFPELNTHVPEKSGGFAAAAANATAKKKTAILRIIFSLPS